MTPRRFGVLVVLGWLLFVAGSLLLASADVRAGMEAVDDVRAHGRPSDLAAYAGMLVTTGGLHQGDLAAARALLQRRPR